MINIQRNFKPIGQGAFYEENICVGIPKRHNFNSDCRLACRMYYCTHNQICMEHVATDTKTIIYDCGTNTSPKNWILYNEIKRIKSDVIDVLFISHFDYDHINGIPYLLSFKKIINVVLPQIDNQMRYLNTLRAINEGANPEQISLVLNTRGYLEEKGVNVIEVEPIGLEEVSEIKFDDIEMDIDRIKEIGSLCIESSIPIDTIKSIKSGQIISASNIDWGWIPFNIDYEESKLKLKKEVTLLESKYVGLVNADGTIDQKYILTHINDNTSDFRKDILNIYKSKLSKKGTNENSLVLYSGPVFLNSEEKYAFLNTPHTVTNKTGCLYCGDYNTKPAKNLNQLKSCYKNVWDKIGTIQIPHHGSKYNFPPKSKVLDLLGGIPIAVISSGKDSSHPHAEVRDLIIHNVQKYYNVTEINPSRHRQCIWRNEDI